MIALVLLLLLLHHTATRVDCDRLSFPLLSAFVCVPLSADAQKPTILIAALYRNPRLKQRQFRPSRNLRCSSVAHGKKAVGPCSEDYATRVECSAMISKHLPIQTMTAILQR